MKVKSTFSELFQIALGTFLLSLSFLVFIIPNNLLAGGISGLAIITNHFTGFSVGALIFLYNIPIVFWARKELRIRFIVYTVISIILQSLFLSYFQFVTPYRNDILLAGIFGGIFSGAGTGLIIRNYGSSGGTDVIAIVLKNKLGISVGTVSFITNMVIISLSGIVFGLEPAMYTLVSLFVTGKTIDFVQEGLNKKLTAMIVSEKSEEIKDVIMFQMKRGVTLIYGAGGYDSTKRNIIYCVVNQFELARLKEVVIMLDPRAFMTISETSEVLGRFSEHSLWEKK